MSFPFALRALSSVRRRIRASDVLFAVVVASLTFAVARVWWISTIVPGMDYPQFLVFVRALRDHTDPSSPFYGTYSVSHWYMPTSLPIHVTSELSHLCGHSIEAAGKVLLTMQNVGLVAATLYLLKLLGRNRWAVLLLFPIIHSSWTVVGGFAAFATTFPLNVLGWALAVRWLRRLDLPSGIMLGLCLCAIMLWHGVGFAQAGLGFAILWALWRAPCWKARALSVLPTLASLALCVVWMSSTFDSKAARGGPPDWMSFWEASERIFEFVWATVPHYGARAIALATVVGAGMALSPANLGTSGPAARMWRVSNPFLVLALGYLAAYFALPNYLNKVEGVSCRFAYIAVLAFIFAWPLPRALAARSAVLAAVGAFGVWCLQDITQRFRAFDADTHGASDLIDRMAPHETLYYSPPGEGASKDFDGPANKPMRELEQYATVRWGGLPNSSFAGYGINYIRYTKGQNPMPGLSGLSWTPDFTKFDYVLTRAGAGPKDRHFTLFARVQGWELYGVCGSRRFPTCT